MPSKLGPHCLRPTRGARQLIDAGCRIVKLVDDFGLAPELAARPGLTLIGRVYADNPRTAEEQRRENPEVAARRFIDSQKDKYLANASIKIWEGHNEPVWGSREDMEWYAKFEIARLKILGDMGLRGVIGCFATGNPGDIELWKWYVPAVQAAKQMNGILGLHEYSSPWVWWMSGRFQLNPNENAGDEGWTTLRYRKVMNKFLRPAGCDDVQIAITEFGLDRVSPVPPGASTGNWRTNAGWWPSWDGSRDPIDYWRASTGSAGGRDAEIYYAEQMIWYDQEMRKDPNVLGATIFTFGSSNPAWDDYNIEGTRVVAHLVNYIRGQATVQDQAGGASTVTPKPATQPQPATPAEKPSPVVITAPAQGTTTGGNLFRNANFDGGFYHWRGVPEIVIPNEWEFWYQTDNTTRLDRQDQSFDPPECVVWNIAGAPLEERNLFFLSGDYCLKIFKGWGVIWWRLFQKVSGLTPGQRYRFTAPVYPDLYMDFKKEGPGKILADDPLAGEVRLSSKSGGQEVETGWLNGSKFPFGKYTHFTLDFVAKGTEAEVALECRGRWGILNNGWFCDSLKLETIGAAPTQPTTPITTPTKPTTPSQPKTGSILQNPSFAGGTLIPNPNLRNLEAPKGWTLGWADEKTPKVAKQTESFRPPQASVITPANATADDKDGLAGGLAQTYRVVGNWRAIWFSLSQKVSGLTPGQRYTFNINLMPDPVDKYLPPNNGKKFVADADGGEVWLKSQSGGQQTETYKRVIADFKPGGYVTFAHDFTASAAEATVTVEVRSRFALTQSAWYFASADFTPASGAAVATIATPAPAANNLAVVRGQTGKKGIRGELRLAVQDKFKYASQIENIKVVELITNTTNQRRDYGVVGVEIVNRDTNEKTFHTSFSGDLKLGPNCQGPKDECGGEWLDQLRIDKAGNYKLALAICYNNVQEALNGRGDWETLTPYIDIVVDNWRPS